jgi:hypothetical protein
LGSTIDVITVTVADGLLWLCAGNGSCWLRLNAWDCLENAVEIVIDERLEMAVNELYSAFFEGWSRGIHYGGDGRC